MSVLNETKRKPSYMNDIYTYGDGGENLFMSLEHQKINERGYKLFDVRTNKDYQFVDIDFVISKNSNLDELPNINEVLDSKDFIKVEVKTDMVALFTKNLPYEFISHESSGWSVITKADYIYMILCREHDDKVIAEKVLWVDMHKWTKLVENRRIKKKINYIKNECIVDLLCKIEDMNDNGVIISEKKVFFDINGRH
jgi:hypothetical protein